MPFPTTFPSFWTQADIDRYRETWESRESQGLTNPDPWWVANPEWAETPLTLQPASSFAPTDQPVTVTQPTETVNIQELNSQVAYWESQIKQAEDLLNDPTAPENLDRAEIQRNIDTYRTNADLIRQHIEAGVGLTPDIAILTSKEAQPFVSVTKDGRYQVDVDGIVRSGMDPMQLKQIGITDEAIAQVKTLNKLVEYKTSRGYDLARAIEDGKESLLLEAGFKQKDISETKKIIEARNLVDTEIKQAEFTRQETLDNLEKYKVEGGYNIALAISEGVDEKTLLSVGFTQEQISKQSDMVEYYKATPEQKFNILKQQGLVPSNAKYIGLDENGNVQYAVEGSGKITVNPDAKGKPTYNKETKLWYDPATNLYYDKFGTVFYNEKGDVVLVNAPNTIDPDTIAGQLVIAMTPVVGTVYFWQDMPVWQKVLSVAGDVLFFDSLFNASRIGSAITRVVMQPVKQAIGKVPKFSQIMAKVGDDMAGIFKGADALDEYQAVVKAQLQYGDDIVEMKRAEAALDTIKSQPKPKVNTPYAKIYQSELDAAEIAYERARQAIQTSNQNLIDVSRDLTKKIAGNVGADDARAAENFNRLPQEIARHTESVATDYANRTYLLDHIDDIDVAIKAKEAELAALKVKYPTNPSAYIDISEDLARLESKKMMALAGNIEDLQKELAATREFIEQARSEVKKPGTQKIVWQDELDMAVKKEAELEAKLDKAVKTMEVEASRFRESGGFPTRIRTDAPPRLGGGSSPTTLTPLAKYGPAIIIYAVGKTFPASKIIPQHEIEPIITTTTKIVTTTVPKITPAEKQDIQTIIREAAKVHNATKSREEVIARINEEIMSRTGTAVHPVIKPEAKVQPKTETQLKPETQGKTETPEKVIEPWKPAEGFKPLPVPHGAGDKEHIEKPRPGAVTWNQGIGWWTRWDPYGKKQMKFSLRPPDDAIVVKNSKSAYDTIQSLRGKAGTIPKMDMGVFDVHIKNPPVSPTRRNRAAIRFTRDPSVKPKHHKSGVKNRRVGIYYTSGNMVSRHPIGRR